LYRRAEEDTRMSFLARLSLANRGLVALIAIVVTGFGFVAIPSLKQQLLPSLEFPIAFVAAPYPGASPDVVDEQVVRPLASAVRGVDGLTKVTSTASEGTAGLRLEFEFGTDLDAAVNQLQTAVGRVDADLPDGVEPRVFAGSTDDLPVVVLAAAGGSGDERDLADRLRRWIVPELQALDGVRQVEVTGARDLRVTITPDPAKLAIGRFAPGDIATALQANGITVPAGGLVDGDRSLTVQTGSPLASLDDLRGLYLTPAGKSPVRLGAVATVEQDLAPPTSITRTDGAPSLGLAVTAAPGGNAVDISHAVDERLDDLEEAFGGQLTVVFDQAPFVEKSIDGLTTEGLLGLLMAVLVILVFLLSIRSTLVTAVSIPLSVLVALIALWAGDYSLNLLTLGALTIAVGRVVDDSIVVLENIKRHLSYGESRRRAIVDGVREVAGAVTASTLTTVAVFAPIALVGGFVGQLFTPFALTVTAALLASLLVSLTIIPVLAYWFLRPAGQPGQDGDATVRRAAQERELRSPLQRAYLPVIRFATRRRVTTVLIGALVLVGTFGLASRLETNFIDGSGQDTFVVDQQLPIGTSLAATDAAAQRVERVLAGTDGVSTYQVTVGRGELFGLGGEGGSNTAQFQVTVAEKADAEAVQARVRERLDELSDGAGDITVSAGGGGGPAGDQLEVVVQAAEPPALEAAVERVRAAMAGTPEVADVTTSLTQSAPRVEVDVDRMAAAQKGLSEDAIAQAVAQAFRGAPLGRLTLDGEQQDVVLRLGTVPDSVDALRALPLPTRTGLAPLDTVADVVEVAGPVELTRIDGARSATVTGTATGSDIGATTEELKERLAELELPGATYTVGGVSADQAEAFGDLGRAVLAAIAIVFLIMVAAFRSLVQPLILLVSVPFAATGAIALLLATGTPLGVPALIGVLMLVGIVVTNAIVLMDLINQYRRQGMGVREAVVEGGRRRLRPILMTAIATIFALLPMALGLTGEGGFISQPLAIVVIGGLISSTLLTLVLVPTLYTMVENAKQRLRPRRPAAPSAPTPTAVDEPAPAPSRVPVPVAALRERTDQFEVLRLPKPSRPVPPRDQ
jgi:HAE1 family hydrophobic/amphiphilic exporter-1